MVEVEPTQTVRVENRSFIEKYGTPLAIALGLLLIVGGITLGIRTNREANKELADYNPVYLTPESSTNSPVVSPSAAVTPSESQVVVAEVTPSPIPTKTTTKKSIPKVAGTATSKVAPVIKSSPLPAYTPTQSQLSDYQPVVPLSDYQPQFSAPSPEAKQTISVTITVGDSRYSVEVSPGSTILQSMQSARSQGLNFTTKSFTGLGEMVTEINGQSQTNSQYWTFTVNGAFSQSGISSRTLNAGDVINWTLS